MIGGSKTRKKAVGENTSSLSKTVLTEVKLRKRPMSAPVKGETGSDLVGGVKLSAIKPRQTVTMDSGRY